MTLIARRFLWIEEADVQHAANDTLAEAFMNTISTKLAELGIRNFWDMPNLDRAVGHTQRELMQKLPTHPQKQSSKVQGWSAPWRVCLGLALWCIFGVSLAPLRVPTMATRSAT